MGAVRKRASSAAPGIKGRWKSIRSKDRSFNISDDIQGESGVVRVI